MNIRLVIDRLVVEGLPLSPSERVALEETLRMSLIQSLNERTALQALPEGRNARRERMQVNLPEKTDGVALGGSLGTSLANHVWEGPILQSDGHGAKR
jgi:hypothetical protein